jgi:hypothetical protein
MKNNRKQQQREEVRKILHTMRLELAAQRFVQERLSERGSVLRLDEFIKRAQKAAY